MEKFITCVEDEHKAFFQDGKYITDKESAFNLIEKIKRFYDITPSKDIKEYNEKVRAELVEKLEIEHLSDRDKIYENSKFVEKYDSTHFSLSLEEIENLYENEKVFEAELIDMREIKYPLIVTFYKNNEIVEIGFTQSKFDRYIAGKRNEIEFDTYSILEVKETELLGIYTHLKLAYMNKPWYSLPVENGVYVTFNQIKKRYKYVDRMKPSKIKDIISIYNVHTVLCENGTLFVDKRDFDNAVKKYLS